MHATVTHLPATCVATPTGASAVASGEVITLCDARGRLVARFDAASDTLVIEGAARLELRASERLTLQSDEVVVRAKRHRIEVGSHELSAERIVERSRDVFRSVERLLETRARRARTIVERLFELSANRTSIRSSEDTSIDGKRVLLG
jgi:hypothetical protein